MAMERPVLTFAIVILIMAMGSAAVAGFYTQGGAAGQAWAGASDTSWLSPVQAARPSLGRAYTTSTPGRRGTSVAPLSISSAASFQPGDTIRVCLDGEPCTTPAYRKIVSMSGADLVLDAPVTLTVAPSPVSQAPEAPSVSAG